MSFVSISDHFHPWIARQGHSPFVWSVLGGIAASTERIEVMTGVTCPLIRIQLPLPRHFEQAISDVTEEDVADQVICGPDPERHVQAIREYVDAGFDHVYLHQVGPDQEGFFRFFRDELRPLLSDAAIAA